ncbi:MAG: hypothetical protein HPY44_21395 [Armatimonadetes bacterium]|nr:hypothetical protein [Armatimonadota bacterium]
MIPGVLTLLLLLVLFTGVSAAGPQVIIDTDFGAADQPVLTRGDRPNERVTGVMAGNWRDDSGWTEEVFASWTAMEEEGRRFLRLKVQRLGPHWYQLCHPTPKIDADSFFRLKLTARSTQRIPLQVGIRDSAAPYKFHWQKSVALNSEWQDFSADFRLGAIEQDVGVWVSVNTVGELDIARFSLTRLSRDDYVDELKKQYGEEGPANLVAQSRFPLGLPTGWALDRDNSDGDDVIIAPDDAVTGPSGVRALKVSCSERTVLYSAPFAVPMAFMPHTASLYLRGTGEFAISVRCDGRQIARRAWTLSSADAWERVWVKFDPVLMAGVYGVVIEAPGTFWLDAMQVHSGAEPVPYCPQQPCEVALAIPESDASCALVQFADEPARVNWMLTGETQRAHLRARVVNVYGQTRELECPAADGATSGQVSFDAFPERPFGPFRVEAWAEDAAGSPLSPVSEIVVNRLPRPHYWGKDAPNSPFGVHTNSTTRHNRMLKAIGANWTRLHDAGLQYLGWYHIEKQPGQWTFHDKEIYRYRREHVKILGELGTAPFWASYYPGKPHSGYFDQFYQPKRLEDYENYVKVVTERYKGVIDAYDVWNEPWIHSWWAVGYNEGQEGRAGYVPSEDPQGSFTRLMAAAYRTAKATDPNITILGFNTTTGGGSSNNFSGTDWTRGVLEAGGLSFCDAVCYHMYIGGKPGYPGDVVEQGTQRAISPLLEEFGEMPKPLWMTEGSAGRDTLGAGFYKYTLPYENKEDVWETADRLCRYVVATLAQGVDKLFLYSMHAQSGLHALPEGGWRVIVTPEGFLHPSGVAHGALAWQLEDARFVEVVTLREGLYAYLFEAKDGSRSVAAISPRVGEAGFTVPDVDRLTAYDLFGNPVAAGKSLGSHLGYVSMPGKADGLRAVLAGQ